ENLKDGQGLIDKIQEELNVILDDRNLTEKQKRKIEKHVKSLDNPDVVVSKIYQYISWSFFILMPWFAFILYVFFRKKRKFYVEHLIYSVNLHTFFFLVMIMTALLGMAIPKLQEKGGVWVFLFVVIYSILGIRNFYKIKLLRSVFYSSIIFATYLFSTLALLLTAIIIVVALI
ncbi:MAG: hypothetical protein KAH17_06215, partial [Bacteroidales bacterium]|nr:hypothetical protein [Bacteroidales bacterium]